MVDRGETAPVHVDQHHRLADLLQGGQDFRLEKAGAQDCVGLVQADLLKEGPQLAFEQAG